MLRKFRQEERELYIQMAKEFYSSDAVLHSVDEKNFEKTFDEIVQNCPYAEAYALENEGQVVGYVLLAKTFSQEAGGVVVWIVEIYVRPEFQGKGIANSFFREYEKQLDSKIARLRLEVEPGNQRAIALYQKLGFEMLSYQQMVKEKVK